MTEASLHRCAWWIGCVEGSLGGHAFNSIFRTSQKL